MADEYEEEENGECELYTLDDLLEWAKQLECIGIVSKYSESGQDDFYYLSLSDSWQNSLPFFLSNISRILQYDKQSKANTHKLIQSLREKREEKGGRKEEKEKEKERIEVIPSAESVCFFAPPGNVGLHVSIAKDSLGKIVPFRLTKVMRYANQKIGCASQFDSTKYVAEWIAFRVELDESAAVPTVSSPHISIAAFGFEIQSGHNKGAKDSSKSQKKKGK